ncbi:MAG: sulfurtransferase-like selenium metabolism protein YedF [Firmicutes bacterium]|nr:sulfurtransferase-like selenium metabolism protein YedF [Bacillota bacterium]
MQIVDCRGQACPQPVLNVKKALAKGPFPLEVLVDTPEAAGNVGRLLDANRCEYTCKSSGTLVRFMVNSPGAATESPKGEAPVWLLTADVLGSGDRELGRVLMKSLLHTIGEGPPPAVIYFLNAGVRLCAGPDALSSHLQPLADRGVDLACCGTCLDFFKLQSELHIGRVTNMYEIVEGIQTAGKVITI